MPIVIACGMRDFFSIFSFTRFTFSSCVFMRVCENKVHIWNHPFCIWDSNEKQWKKNWMDFAVTLPTCFVLLWEIQFVFLWAFITLVLLHMFAFSIVNYSEWGEFSVCPYILSMTIELPLICHAFLRGNDQLWPKSDFWRHSIFHLLSFAKVFVFNSWSEPAEWFWPHRNSFVVQYLHIEVLEICWVIQW